MGVKVRERPKGSGTWWVFIDHQSKRKAKKIGRDKRLALDVAKKIEAKLVLGHFKMEDEEGRAPTVGELSRTWMSVTIPATCKSATILDYRAVLKHHVLPVFDKTPVNEVDRFKVKNFLLAKINAGYAQSTVTHMKNALSGILNMAVDAGHIQFNPAQRLGKIFKGKPLRDGIDALTQEELSTLLETFQRHFAEHYPLTLTLARTGMRYGEALALQWGDIDFNGRFIRVSRGFSRGRLEETPKSGKARPVDMSKQLAHVLQGLLVTRKKETLARGWKEVPQWVFVSETGTPIDQYNWRRRVFYKALSKAGIRHIRIHDLRHTYASLLLQAGESLTYIRDQLGHASIKMTVDIYGHMAPGGNRDAVDRLDDEIFTATIRNLSATGK